MSASTSIVLSYSSQEFPPPTITCFILTIRHRNYPPPGVSHRRRVLTLFNELQPFGYNATPRLSSSMTLSHYWIILCPANRTGFWKRTSLVAGAGFEPASFGLWDRAGASPVHPAMFHILAGTVGFEPTTITLTGCRSTSWAMFPIDVALQHRDPWASFILTELTAWAWKGEFSRAVRTRLELVSPPWQGGMLDHYTNGPDSVIIYVRKILGF